MKRVAVACGLMLSAPAWALDPEVNLAGTFALSGSYYDSDIAGGDWDVENNASNFRVSAAAQEVGVRAFMAYERGANNDGAAEGVREFFAGIGTDYGTLIYGRKASDYRLAGERLDPFYNTSVAGYNGQFASEGASYGLSNLTNGFTSNTVVYRSPVLAGVSFNLGGYISDNAEPNDKHDATGGISYTNTDWGIDVGAQYLFISGTGVVAGAPGKSNAIRVHGSYGQKLWAIGLSYESVDVDAELDPRQYAFLAASYQVLEYLRLAAAVGNVADTDTAPVNFDGTGGSFGAFFDLTRNLSLYGAVRYVDLVDVEDQVLTAAVGTKFVFDVDL